MATTEIREFAEAGLDANSRTVQAGREPANVVHFENTGTGAKTVALTEQTHLVQITSSVAIKYELAQSNPDSAAGAKRGEIPLAAMPYLIPVKPGYQLEVSE